ncbi:FecR domain-containing protein [Gaetbulibacter sp. M235]|uniref:FecR family protein n=1 Tax=Gaetbulibacter sp. M235 TaxID=3126510 RepID=UPI00374F995A
MEFKIIIKKLNNTLSKEEEVLFNDWYNESADHRLYFENVKENYKNDVELINIEKAWNSIHKKIAVQPKKTKYLKYAAAAVLLLSISFLIKNRNTEPNEDPVIVINDIIKPGTDKATLILEDGTQIALEKGKEYQTKNSVSNGEEITYSSNTAKSNKIAYNYLTVPRGGEFIVKLADGTKVWLNSESQLKYPTTFIEGQERLVELVYGEAYFEVSPSTEHKGAKFKVINNSQDIEVLGTKFNVKAYKDESQIYTTLAEGKVAVNTKTSNAVLVPGQQSVLNSDDSNFEINTVDVNTELAWIHGDFVFHKKSFKEIIKVLSRWYDVDFEFLNDNVANQRFNGQLSKNQNLETILLLIKNTNKIESYEIKDKTIFLN